MAPALPARVALIGFMGAGKSTVGRLLAARLGYAFVDLDEHIEARSGRPSGNLPAQERRPSAGWRATALAALASRRQVVVAAGGGAPMQANRGSSASRAPSTWKSASRSSSAARLQPGPAPARPPGGELRALFASRLPVYRDFSIVNSLILPSNNNAFFSIFSWT